MTYKNGPYVQAACFCETALQEPSGVFSLIRVIDTLIRTDQGPNPPISMTPFSRQLKFILMLKSGSAVGRYEIKIIPEYPNGQTLTPSELSAQFDGEERGCNFILDVPFEFPLEGLYWFRVLLIDGDKEEEITAIPLRVKYQRIVSR
jgi:hypothetical protein